MLKLNASYSKKVPAEENTAVSLTTPVSKLNFPMVFLRIS